MSAATISPGLVFSSIYINEVSPNTDPEWVELFNSSSAEVDLVGWALKDASQKPQSLSGTISAQSYFIYEHASGWLNNSGLETLALYDSSSPSAQVDSVSFGTSSIENPGSNSCLARVSDGGVWQSPVSCTRNTANFLPPTATPIPPTFTPQPPPSPTPKAPTSTPSLSPSRTPTPSLRPSSIPATIVVPASASAVLAAASESSQLASPSSFALLDSPSITPAPVSRSSSAPRSFYPYIAIGAGILSLASSGILAYWRARRYTS